MVLGDLQNKTVTLPLIGSISVIAALGISAVLFFALRRKKSIGLRI